MRIHWEHGVLVWRAREHDVGLRRVGVQGPGIDSGHLPHRRADDHDMRPRLHPMALVGCIRIVIAGPPLYLAGIQFQSAQPANR